MWQLCSTLKADTGPILVRLIGELATIFVTKTRIHITTSQVQDMVDQFISYKSHNFSCCELSRDREKIANNLQKSLQTLLTKADQFSSSSETPEMDDYVRVTNGE